MICDKINVSLSAKIKNKNNNSCKNVTLQNFTINWKTEHLK